MSDSGDTYPDDNHLNAVDIGGYLLPDGEDDWLPQIPTNRPIVNPSRARLTTEEQVLGAKRRLRSREVALRAGVSVLSARRFWRALGLPSVEDEVVAFTEADVTALRTMSNLVRDGVLDDTTALALTRAVGRSVDRLAAWQVQLLGEALSEENTRPPTDIADLAPILADEFAPLVVYAWRRHMASALRRYVSERVTDPTVPTLRRTVGFADLVSFTRLVRRLSERELGAMVNRFESVTSDVITSGGGRVIKTVGDEVLFVAWPPQEAATIGLRIAEQIASDPMLPQVRVGIATGEILSRLGDVFGTTVNLASRITALASPGCVLCDDSTAAALLESPTLRCTPLRRRTVKGLGQVLPWLVTSKSEEPPSRWRMALHLGP
jgi:adenylate cyclase